MLASSLFTTICSRVAVTVSTQICTSTLAVGMVEYIRVEARQEAEELLLGG